jgi:hypothetical protein
MAEHALRRHRTAAAFAACMLLLAACAESPPPPPPPADPPAPPQQPTSYEVAVATAAADRNRALHSCEGRPVEERAACIAVTMANWERDRAAVEDLRGETE